jgi:hypothetical protein
MMIEFKYNIGDAVIVEPIGMSGRIDGMSYESLGIQYRVIYWND